MSIIKRLLMTRTPQITKNTPYIKALGIVVLILAVPEIVVLVALPFKVFSAIEVIQITVFLVGLSLVMPLVLRLSEKKLSMLLAGFALLWLVIAFLQNAGDAYYVNQVLAAYLDGADYHQRKVGLRWVASSSARSFACFIIGESNFQKQCTEDIQAASSLPRKERDERLLSLMEFVSIRASSFEDRFLEIGYSNSTALATLNVVQRNYKKMLSYLSENVQSANSKGERVQQ